MARTQAEGTMRCVHQALYVAMSHGAMHGGAAWGGATLTPWQGSQAGARQGMGIIRCVCGSHALDVHTSQGARVSVGRCVADEDDGGLLKVETRRQGGREDKGDNPTMVTQAPTTQPWFSWPESHLKF
jgi:hypothetical protein